MYSSQGRAVIAMWTAAFCDRPEDERLYATTGPWGRTAWTMASVRLRRRNVSAFTEPAYVRVRPEADLRLTALRSSKSGGNRLNDLDPIAPRQVPFIEGSALKYAPIRFDDFPRSHIFVLTRDKDAAKTDFFRFRNSKGQHFCRVPLTPFARADAVANVATSLYKVRMIDVVANLYRAKKFRTLGIGEKEQVRRHFSWIRFGWFALDNRKEFIEIPSREKLARRRGRLSITPPSNHVFVSSAMSFVRELQS